MRALPFGGGQPYVHYIEGRNPRSQGHAIVAPVVHQCRLAALGSPIQLTLLV